MSALTISREAGSRGDWIAEQVAHKLGYHLVNKDTLERIFIQYGFVDFKETYDQAGFWVRFDHHAGEMALLLKQAFEALVVHGDVVMVGRGGFGKLKGYADVLNVRIQAPLEMRIKIIMDEMKIADYLKAEEYVREKDRNQHDYLQSIYGSDWKTLTNFDLVIDTGKINAGVAVEWLVTSGKELGKRKPVGQLTTRTLVADPVMLNAAAQVLSQESIPA